MQGGANYQKTIWNLLLKIEKPSENIFMTLFATSVQISHTNS